MPTQYTIHHENRGKEDWQGSSHSGFFGIYRREIDGAKRLALGRSIRRGSELAQRSRADAMIGLDLGHGSCRGSLDIAECVVTDAS